MSTEPTTGESSAPGPATPAPEAAAPDAAQAPDAAPPGAHRARLVLAGVDALLVVAVVLTAVLLRPGSTSGAQVDAVAAAKAAAVDLVSVSWTALDAQAQAAQTRLDPRSHFAQDYQRFLPTLQETARTNKLVLTAEVVSAGVSRVIDARHVVVLAFVDQVSTNAVRASPRVDQSRVVLHMVRRGSRWLVQGLEAL